METPAPVVEEGNEVVKPARRAFLQGSGLAAGAAVVSGTTLATLAAHTARAGRPGHDSDQYGWSFQGYRSEYGSLDPTPDQNGDHILALPRDFQYVTFSKIGDRLSDGNICPRAHDGMTCLEGRGSVVRLIRNHEVRTSPGASTIRARSHWVALRTNAMTRSASAARSRSILIFGRRSWCATSSA